MIPAKFDIDSIVLHVHAIVTHLSLYCQQLLSQHILPSRHRVLFSFFKSHCVRLVEVYQNLIYSTFSKWTTSCLTGGFRKVEGRSESWKQMMQSGDDAKLRRPFLQEEKQKNMRKKPLMKNSTPMIVTITFLKMK